MANRSFDNPSWPDRLVGVLPFLSILGLLGIFVSAAVGFEEPHTGLMGLSGALLAVAPVGLLLHLLMTAELDPMQKRTWCLAFLGRNGPGLMLAYFDPQQRRVLTRWLRIHSVSRSSP